MRHLIIVAFSVLMVAVAGAQEPEQPAEPTAEQLSGFAWLKQFEGTWATDYNGTMKCRVIGKRWVVNELSFKAGVYSIQTLGYDEKKKQFLGTWVDTSSSHLWRYTGSLDAKGKVLVLEADGPDMSDPKKTRRYRDSYEFKSKDEIVAVAQMLNDEKKWTTISKGTMTRKPK